MNKNIKEHTKKRIKIDVEFRLTRNTRRRIHHALNGRLKSSSTKKILGIGFDTYRKWLEFQMTPYMTLDKIVFDHVKPICMFDVSEDKEIKEAFSWKDTQPLLKHDHRFKGIKFEDYQLQFIRAYQFLKLNEEGLN